MNGVRDTELGDAQRAARLLLNHGLVTPMRVPEREWQNLRRYAEPLKEAFTKLAGYRVEIGPTSVALIRRIDRLSDTPIFTTPSKRPFDRVRYALVALVLAALERLGPQTTLSDLSRQVRRAAENTPSLPFDPDRYASRLAMGHAVRVLEGLGALTLTDGSREAWEQSRGEGEALYTIDRALCRRLFPIGMRQPDATTSLLHRDPTELGQKPMRTARRQRLIRRILEQPVVYKSDLDAAERSYLQRESRTWAQALEDLTGAQVVRRREGVALLDPGHGFSDRRFPTGGAANQAALLLGTRLYGLAKGAPQIDAPHSEEASDALEVALIGALGTTKTPPVRERVARPFIDTPTLGTLAASIADEYGAGLTQGHREHPQALLNDAIDVLAALDLIRRVPGGVALMPALARFREVQIRTATELAGQLTMDMQ